MDTRRAVPRHTRGFSLAELLLAATLGALLVTTAASSAGSFSQTVAQLRSDVIDDYEAVTARIARDVRYAWWAEVPASDHLRLADAAGQITEYFRVGNSLIVRRPSGDEGSVITGLAGVLFEQTTQRRLREANQAVVNGRIGGPSAPPTTVSPFTLESGNALGLGFMVPSNAGSPSVVGVEERYVARTPDRIDLLVAKLGSGTLHGDIYAARAPGDGTRRPGASSLASFDVALTSLPAVVVLIPAVGGLFGHPATYAAPAVSVPIAVTGAQALLPGVAYTLVLSVNGSGTAFLASHVNVAGANDAVVFRSTSWSSWSTKPLVFAFGVSGNSVTTATAAHDVTSQIRVTLTPTDQPGHIASAAVFSQVLAEDPWLGVVPGETPPAP